MKTFQSILYVLFLGLTLTTAAQKTTTKRIDVQKSELTWKGYKIAGQHEGTINLKSGQISFEKNKLVSGEFVVDMTSVSATDVSGKGKEKLDGHLKSEDFFDVEKFPEATLTFTKAKEISKGNYEVTGILIIKGIKQEITFKLTVENNTASTTIEIDRTKYDIKYRSGTIFPELADKAIKDNFDITAKLVF